MNRSAPADTPQAALPLAGRLPTLAAPQAALSRLALDRRFAQWLGPLLAQPALSVSRQSFNASWQLSLATDHGQCVLAIDPGASAALQLALELDNHASACAVVTQLLEPWTAAFAPSLGSIRVSALSRIADGAAADLVTVGTGDARVGVHHCDDALAERLAVFSRHGPEPDIGCFSTLPLRSRIRLMARSLPRDTLASLQAGDVVLCGEQSPLLFCGVGHCLRARLYIHPQEFTVHVAEDPHMSQDEVVADAPPEAADTLASLQLPVAFELDTARVSLAELASMQPGYAVELDVPLHEARVRLTCHGQTLGHGQLVAIGDRLGVRIVHLEFAHDAAVAS